MTTRDNGYPPTPDWLPDSPRCANDECRCRESYCRFLADKQGRESCTECTHALNPLRMPALYDGDQN